MQRALLALGGTAAGIAALVAVKFHPGAAGLAAAGTAPAPTVPASTVPASTVPASTAATAPTGKVPTAKAPATKAATGGTAAGGGTGGAPRTFTGMVDDTQYGPMQVQVTVAGTKISKVTVLRQTDTGSESQQIDARAIPQLTMETLAANSAQIDAVSGASYTSAGYVKSLQSALDQAGL